ncbi:hypothetical protein BGY98DRAFT_1008826, partial [Russula aff. rugulosa BPL654]
MHIWFTQCHSRRVYVCRRRSAHQLLTMPGEGTYSVCTSRASSRNTPHRPTSRYRRQTGRCDR